MGNWNPSATFRAIMAAFLVIVAVQVGMGGLLYIMLGVFGEAEPLTDTQSIGLGLLLWALVLCLLAGVNLILRGRGARGELK